MTMTKLLLRALGGETLPTPPIWMMRQAGRYLPEYRATRAEAGDFLKLCYNSDLAAEVTLQPIRRYGFDAAILFADILLLPQALGADLWFETGEGPRLSTITTRAGVKALKPKDAIHDTLGPIYETVRILARELPKETALIGFAGAPWTVATYMIAGRGTKDQGPAHALKAADRATFSALIDVITDAASQVNVAGSTLSASQLLERFLFPPAQQHQPLRYCWNFLHKGERPTRLDNRSLRGILDMRSLCLRNNMLDYMSSHAGRSNLGGRS